MLNYYYYCYRYRRWQWCGWGRQRATLRLSHHVYCHDSEWRTAQWRRYWRRTAQTQQLGQFNLAFQLLNDSDCLICVSTWRHWWFSWRFLWHTQSCYYSQHVVW